MQTMSRIYLVLLIAFGITASLSGQVICLPSFPGDSPVLAPDIDAIPPTNDQILTYAGTHVAARANIVVNFLQIGPDEQRVWFFTDHGGAIDHFNTYYNRRYRAGSSSPWYWQFSTSPSIINSPTYDPGAPAPEAVLYSATPRYIDTRTNTAYNYIMYQLSQPHACLGVSAGFLYVAFSNDGICWTSGQLATRLGGPSYDCVGAFGASNTVPIEAMTAFDDGTDIRLIGTEGDVAYLGNHEHMDETALIGYTAASNPSNILLYESPKVSNTGIYSPVGLYQTFCCSSYNARFQPYNYFINMQAAYDPSSGDFYVGRSYAYPFDRGAKDSDYPVGPGVVPQLTQGQPIMMFDSVTGRTGQVGGCNQSPSVLANRIQLYKMHIGPLSNFAALGTTGVWTLLADLGNSSGYSNAITGAATTPLTYFQTNVGRDYGAVSFLRDGRGYLVRKTDGTASFFAGDTFELSKSSGPCQVTGLERETVLAVP